MERITGIFAGVQSLKYSNRIGIILRVEGKDKTYYGNRFLMLAIWEEHLLDVGDRIYLDIEKDKISKYGPLKESD